MREELDLLGDTVIRRSADFLNGDRITLTRRWNDGPMALVIGHNPSNADAWRDDPTCRWWIDWFRFFGFGGFVAVNLYPFVTPDPAECRRMADWASRDDWGARDALLYVNLPRVSELAKQAHQVFVCWGAIAEDGDWIEHVVDTIHSDEGPWPDLWCWGKTASGAPKHPLARGASRIAKDQQPILWRAAP